MLAMPFYALSAWLSACGKRVLPLPRLNIDPSGITISGLSSGAHFAAQFQVAFSKTIAGVGIDAGYPWHCDVTKFANDTMVPTSENNHYCENCAPNETIVRGHCANNLTNPVIEVDVLVAAARRYAAAGRIDDVENLRNKKVYTYDGIGHGYSTFKN